MCYTPPAYSKCVIAKPSVNESTEEKFERIIRKVITSADVIETIADRVGERVLQRIEKTRQNMTPVTQVNTALIRHKTNGIMSTAGSSVSHIKYQPVTEKEISSVMAALPGVTWHRCRLGHLYAVGECGNPVVSSHCLECKESINH
ncbi:hypothetical protein COEREDRAFT_6769 [Coemansia reversa NRRL 1564]|uniref:RZ-type domain-containing protein n=1 Tax=Coemansia reversa (strain ATCC 12441 / NRRL 1564) TaxID=763665 RepID=A0A2G5BG71_COERN|nr:hypothetical protein COEREDRAFT_6769 [Coemansia reversa NRRL 1564]|eukprot:PIA18028.1 hypothetical protein COEREDRAFT_6769 [Coemansia reversa NRRL 1564]